MLITFIALRSLWRVWREQQQRRLARKNLRQLTENGQAEEAREVNAGEPFWPSVRAHYLRDASSRDAKRARSRKAISRLSRISERNQAKRASLRSTRGKDRPHPR